MAKLETLFDAFLATSRDSSKWSQFQGGSATMSYTTGGASSNMPSSATSSSDADITSQNTYDLTGSFGFLNVIAIFNTGTHADATFAIWQGTDDSNAVQWQIEAGVLYAQKIVASVQSNLFSVIWDSTNHAYLQIRESGGTIFWETSQTGLPGSWTTQFSAANPITVTACHVNISGVCFQAETNAGSFTFAHFNTNSKTADPVTLNGDSDVTDVAQYIGNASATFAGDSSILLSSGASFPGDSDMSVAADYIPINPYGTAPSDFEVLINGVDRTRDVVAGSISIDDLLYDQANTAQFNMEIISGSATPDTDQEVAIWLDGVLQFGGLVDAVKSQRNAGQFDTFEIDCVDYTRLLDRRLVNQTYNDMLDIDIVASIISDYASDEGITMDGVTTDGITVSQISWNYVSPSQALSDLAKLTGRFWYIDYNKDLNYFPLLQNQATFDVTDDSNTFSNLQTSKDTSQLRNRVFVQGGTELSDPFTESQKADGVKTVFLLAEHPHNISMTVNGSAKTIGIENIDDPTTVNFLLNYEEKYMKVGNATTPANGDTLSFTYQYDVPVLVSLEDTNSIVSDGVYEFAIIDNTISTTDAARDRATAELTDYAQKLVSISYNTMVRNLRSGMYQNVSLTPQGISGDYIITEVKMQSITGGLFVTTVTLTSAKVLGIIKFLIDMLNITHTVGTFDPNATVDGFSSLIDSLNPLSDSLQDSLGGSAAKWSNDPGTTTNKLKWSLGQWQ